MTTHERPHGKVKTSKTHTGRMEKHLQKWGVRLDELVARVDAVSSETQAEYRKSMDELKAKYHEVKSQVGKLQTAGNDKWDIFKNGIEIAWKDLERTYTKLRKSNHFGKTKLEDS